MTTIIPTPAPVPDPLSSDFGTKAYDFTVWMADAAPAMTAVSEEMNEALNASLLGVTATSTSSIAIVSSGNVSLTVTPNKGYAIGMTVKIASVANPVNYIKGTVTAFTSLTGAMTVAVFNKGGSGTFANWSVFFDVPDPSVLSVPTGESVAAGNLLAIDNAGNSMSAGSITTAVLQAVTATSFHACPLANGNTAIFWTAGSTDVRMMIINKSGGTVLASTSVTTGKNGGLVWSVELSNTNIVFVYFQITTGYPVFKIVNPSGVQVVAETVIESADGSGQIKCCALTGGGFAVTYNLATNNRYAVYANNGTSVLAPTNNVAGEQSMVAICPTAAGGFVALAGITSLTGYIYNSAGTLVSTCALNIPMQGNAGIASRSGSVVGAGRQGGTPFYGPTLHLASDTANSTINSPDAASNAYIRVAFEDPLAGATTLGTSDVAALVNGLYMATYSSASSSNEYPRYVMFSADGQTVKSGILFTETTFGGVPVYIIPKDTNGFSLIWLAANRNIKFAQVKSGNLVGISLGSVGATHQYLANGSANVTSGNMLNVGSSKINYVRYSAKVVI